MGNSSSHDFLTSEQLLTHKDRRRSGPFTTSTPVLPLEDQNCTIQKVSDVSPLNNNEREHQGYPYLDSLPAIVPPHRSLAPDRPPRPNRSRRRSSQASDAASDRQVCRCPPEEEAVAARTKRPQSSTASASFAASAADSLSSGKHDLASQAGVSLSDQESEHEFGSSNFKDDCAYSKSCVARARTVHLNKQQQVAKTCDASLLYEFLGVSPDYLDQILALDVSFDFGTIDQRGPAFDRVEAHNQALDVSDTALSSSSSPAIDRDCGTELQESVRASSRFGNGSADSNREPNDCRSSRATSFCPRLEDVVGESLSDYEEEPTVSNRAADKQPSVSRSASLKMASDDRTNVLGVDQSASYPVEKCYDQRVMNFELSGYCQALPGSQTDMELDSALHTSHHIGAADWETGSFVETKEIGHNGGHLETGSSDGSKETSHSGGVYEDLLALTAATERREESGFNETRQEIYSNKVTLAPDFDDLQCSKAPVDDALIEEERSYTAQHEDLNEGNEAPVSATFSPEIALHSEEACSKNGTSVKSNIDEQSYDGGEQIDWNLSPFSSLPPDEPPDHVYESYEARDASAFFSGSVVDVGVDETSSSSRERLTCNEENACDDPSGLVETDDSYASECGSDEEEADTQWDKNKREDSACADPAVDSADGDALQPSGCGAPNDNATDRLTGGCIVWASCHIPVQDESEKIGQNGSTQHFSVPSKDSLTSFDKTPSDPSGIESDALTKPDSVVEAVASANFEPSSPRSSPNIGEAANIDEGNGNGQEEEKSAVEPQALCVNGFADTSVSFDMPSLSNHCSGGQAFTSGQAPSESVSRCEVSVINGEIPKEYAPFQSDELQQPEIFGPHDVHMISPTLAAPPLTQEPVRPISPITSSPGSLGLLSASAEAVTPQQQPLRIRRAVVVQTGGTTFEATKAADPREVGKSAQMQAAPKSRPVSDGGVLGITSPTRLLTPFRKSSSIASHGDAGSPQGSVVGDKASHANKDEELSEGHRADSTDTLVSPSATAATFHAPSAQPPLPSLLSSSKLRLGAQPFTRSNTLPAFKPLGKLFTPTSPVSPVSLNAAASITETVEMVDGSDPHGADVTSANVGFITAADTEATYPSEPTPKSANADSDAVACHQASVSVGDNDRAVSSVVVAPHAVGNDQPKPAHDVTTETAAAVAAAYYVSPGGKGDGNTSFESDTAVSTSALRSSSCPEDEDVFVGSSSTDCSSQVSTSESSAPALKTAQDNSSCTMFPENENETSNGAHTVFQLLNEGVLLHGPHGRPIRKGSWSAAGSYHGIENDGAAFGKELENPSAPAKAYDPAEGSKLQGVEQERLDVINSMKVRRKTVSLQQAPVPEIRSSNILPNRIRRLSLDGNKNSAPVRSQPVTVTLRRPVSDLVRTLQSSSGERYDAN